MRHAAVRAIRQFFKTTTLHGFKYLCSEHYVDRIGWVLCCCTSACCAGLLSIVLWARFLEMPALLTLYDDTRANQFTEVQMPAVAVCPPADSIAHMFVDELSSNKTITKRLPTTLQRLLSGRSTATDQLLLLDRLLLETDKTLPEVMQTFPPNCSEMVKRCRYQKTMVPCEQIFEKELVSWRLCCVMRPNKLTNVTLEMDSRFQVNQMLELALQCSSGATLYGCEVSHVPLNLEQIVSSHDIGWVLCCCTSACCAGLLSIVLWARFLEMPALLTLYDDTRANQFTEVQMPAVAVCPPADSIAHMFVDELSSNKTITKRLPTTLQRLLSGRSTATDQLLLLDRLLLETDKTLPEVMQTFPPNCSEMVKRCRYQKTMVPCEQIFEKELVSWRLCCVMRPNKLTNVTLEMDSRFQVNQMLELALQCSSGATLYGCEFITTYDNKEWPGAELLLPAYYHLAQLRFVLVPESHDDKLVEESCETDKSYSRIVCMHKCAEKYCGCSDPFTYNETAGNKVPPCSVSRLGCLRAFGYENDASCHCLASCKKLSTYMVLETNRMNLIEHVIDPFYTGINVASASVLSLRINLFHSRVFVLNETETWLTLLSSLGGVFNMFLGVGLFSALEFLYFIIVKLPITIRKTSEVDHTIAPVVLY